MARRKSKLVLSTALITLAIGRAFAAGAEASTTAVAQSDSDKRQITVSLPAQRLAESLRQLAELSGLQLVYDAKIVEGKTSPAVAGAMTSRAALNALLAGSGLGFQFSGDRTVVVTASAKAGDGAVRSVGVVSVQGVNGSMPSGSAVSPLNGVNGSRDVEATEGSGSYTTGAMSISSKIPLPMRDLPQSVSVMTAQQMKDQNLVSARDVLDKMAGITIQAGGNGEEFEIYSRGFQVTSIAFDGGAPLNTWNANRPVLNMDEFDSVQLVRGANGMFAGYDDPGGTLNLVRKKPLDHNQFTYDQSIGSWQNYREVLDITGPLTEDRKLRARAVYSQQDNNFFYKIAQAHKKAVYGVVEYDLAPKTLLTVGASYIREDNNPNTSGLPRYTNGTAIDWSTDTCICYPFSRDKPRKLETFLTIDHEFNSNLSTKLSYTNINQHVDGTYYTLQTGPIEGGSSAATIGGFVSRSQMKASSLESVTTAKFNLFGHEQSLVFGANMQVVNGSGGTSSYLPTSIKVPDIFAFDPYSIAEPIFGQVPIFTATLSKDTKYGLYANLRLTPFDDVHVTLGMRYNSLLTNTIFTYTNSVEYDPDVRDRRLSKPNIGITYDFLKNFTAYGSYQSIYQPQSAIRFATFGVIPPPITGVNTEAGLKWQSTDKKLNAALSVYYVTQKNFYSYDYNSYDYTTGNYTNFTDSLIDYKSNGVDLEVSGELMPRLQGSASYTYNTNSTNYRDPTYGFSQPKTSFIPRNSVKTWLTYRGVEGGPIGRLVLGGGVNVLSNGYVNSYVCTSYNTGGSCLVYSPYAFKTPGYAIVSAKVGYAFTKNLEGSIKFDNITNVKRYQASPYQNTAAYNYYVTPFNVMATLNVKFW